MLIRLIFACYRIILRTRYRVEIKGIENLSGTDPFLILPNHVALVDPQIIVSYLNKYIKVGPVMSQAYFNIPGLSPIFRAIGAVPIGDLDA